MISKFKSRKYATHVVEITLSDGKAHEFNVEYEPSFLMGQYVDPVVLEDGPLLVLGYLSDDADCENPLTSCDGLGAVHTAHRHAGRSEHWAMQQALGLNSGWSRDLECDEVTSRAWAALRSLIRENLTPEFVAYTLAAASDGYTAEEAWNELLFSYERPSGNYYASPFANRVRTIAPSGERLLDDAWQDCVREGLIGDPYAVVLDCYEHGGQIWSLSGGGMQCRWDTTHGAGVWVPDSCLREDLDAVRKSEGLDAARGKAREYAIQALESYNAWLSGDCYGVSIAVFQKAVNGSYRALGDEHACWGYVGQDWVVEAMTDEAAATLNHLRQHKAA